MLSCSETFKHYLLQQEIIKENMRKLSDECPDKVLKFLLVKEYKSTTKNLIDCTWLDNIDKKYLSKTLKVKCNDL